MQDRDNDDRNWRTDRPHRDGRSERGYRGDAAADTPPGSVPGSSYGAWPGHGPDEWRRGYGGYGVSGRGPSPESGWGPGPAGRPRDMLGYDSGETSYGVPGEIPYGVSGGATGDVSGADRDRGRGLDSWAVPGPYTGRGPQDYRRSESAIREEVCERLTRHGQVDASAITVRVEDGEVVLEGDVDSRAAKRMAEDAADSVSGVRDVHNRLRVRHRD